jgi:hypothetical protein
MTDTYSKLAECMGCAPEDVPTLIQQHAPWNGKDVCDDALRERAAVVAWLRYEAEMATGTNTTAAFQHAARLDTLADAIERGEHRREGEK